MCPPRIGDEAMFLDELIQRIQKAHRKNRGPRFVVVVDADYDAVSHVLGIPPALLLDSPSSNGEPDSGDNIPIPVVGELTDKDLAILQYLEGAAMPPKSRTIAVAIGASESYCRERLSRLQKLGRVKKLPDNRYCLPSRDISG